MTSIQEPDIYETALIASLQQYGYDDPSPPKPVSCGLFSFDRSTPV
jgi:hypothetical protein